ncbi:hypothetical protein KWH94_07000 [Citrobacter cronae]|uniref:hypothetical protein n=1 Tax=Citrobacter cronae TaxID=1748967 RepID=UPI0021D31130|nr:hypothetical protein [Citrobacter cronae]MCU6182870.1 hypothetical protein [Citrobacter cronae]
MNSVIFRHIFDDIAVQEAMIAAFSSQDDLGCFLRLHLISETYIEAFIAGSLNTKDIFSDAPADKVKLQMNYSSKAQLAFKLGMPAGAYKGFMLMNKLRNQAAHQINSELITSDFINNLKNFANSIGKRDPEEIKRHGAQRFNDDGSVAENYTFDSSKTPNRIKLMIILSAIFTWTGVEVGVLAP